MADEEILKQTANLPIAERATHANWRVRQAAYEAVKDGCARLFDESDPVLQEYAGIFPKACADGNAAALDTALDALQALARVASVAMLTRLASGCCNNIVTKALSGRPSTVIKATECVLALMEAEQADKVMGPLIEGYNNKVPKVVVAALDVTLTSIRVFGGKVVPVQEVLNALPPLFESKDNKARDKVKEIMAEVARWTSPEVVRAKLYSKMRDAMQQDMDKMMQAQPPGRPVAERYTRKEAAKQAAAGAAAAEAAGDGAAGAEGGVGPAADAQEEEPPQADAYEFCDPRDILPDLKKEFWEGLAAAKWSERKAALTQLKDLAAYPRLAGGDFADVNRELKKLINKDSNIQVVAEAINCTANLAKGLRKEYAGQARSLCPVLLEKLKDKASVVTKACLESLGFMQRYCFGLADVAEDIAAALAHQNPKVKEYTLVWLAECMERETKAGVNKLQPLVLPAAAKCCEDASPAIRDLALNFMTATALKAGSLAALDKPLSSVDERTKKKLEEMVLAAAKGKRPGAPAAAPPAAAASRSSSQRSMTAAVTEQPAAAGRPPAGRPAARPGSGKPPAGPAAGRGKAAAGGSGSGSGAVPAAVDDEAAASNGVLGKADAEAQFLELFGEAVVQGLQDPGWQVRRDSMDALVSKAQEPDAGGVVAVLVQGLAHIPGWDEKNFQVTAKAFEVIRLTAASSSFTKKEALVAVNGAIDKLADLKLKGPASDMLLAVCEAVGPQCVSTWLHKRAAGHKNPKVLSETIGWITSAIQEFGVASIPVASLLEWVKADLGSSTPAVRNACVQQLGVLHSFLGPQVGDLIRADVKPALMTTIEAEFEKHPKVEGYTPPRSCRVAKLGKAAAGGRGGGGGGGRGATAEEAVSVEDLLPRSDISSQITSTLVAGLTSSNWKDRKAALDEVEEILVRSGNRIQPSVGDLMPALKQRYTDTNKNLTLQAVQLLGKLATAMGRPIAREDKGCLSAAIKCLTDPKPVTRQAVVDMLSAWVAVAPADGPLDELLELLGSPKCVGDTMQAAISWMATAAAAGKITGGSSLTAALRAGALGAGFKTAPVREAAAQLFAALVATVGAQELAGVASHLDKSLSKVALEGVAKANGGAAPAAGGGAAPIARASNSGPPRASTSAATSARPSTHGPSAAASSSKGASRPGTASVRASRATGVGASTSGGLPAASLLGEDGPMLIMDNKKEERAKKAKYKGTKFELRPDELQQLEVDLGALATPAFRANLFAKDFKKHCQAADALRQALETSEGGEQDVFPAALAALDLLLKWAVVRLSEGNTATLISVLSMLKVLFERLYAAGHHMTEHEAKTFLPGLVEKCGLAQDRLKADCRELMRKFGTMYPPTRIVLFVQEGLLSKNNRSRVQCAEEIGCLIDREGMRVVTASKSDALTTLARLVSDRDKDIRQAALGALEVVYGYEGAGLWKHLGKLTDQQTGIIEERLKTLDKDLAKRGLAPGYRAAAAAAAASTRASEAGSSMVPAAAAPARLSTGGAVSSKRGAELAEGTVGASALRHLQAEAAAGGVASVLHPLDQPLLANPAAAAGGPATLQSGGGIDPRELSSRLVTLSTQQQLQAVQPLQLHTQQEGAGNVQLQPLASFSSSEEAAAELDKCLVVLQNGQMEDAIEVMKLLCYEMMDNNQRQAAGQRGNSSASSSAMVQELLAAQADRLVAIMAARTREIFSEASASIRANAGRLPNGRACKYCLNVLMSVFSSSSLPRGVACHTAHDLMQALLLRLADDQLGRVAEGENLLKALNVLMLKILENSNRNHCFAALLELCLEVPSDLAATAEAQTRWADLVVKCLIKITKALPATIEALDLKALLLAISNFFEALGVEEIRRRASHDDKPLRMVKTILHELCKLKGTDIYKYTGAIPQTNKDGSKAVIFPYIDLNIQTLASSAAARSYVASNGGGAAATPGESPAVSRPGTAAAGTAGAVRSSATFADKELKQRVAVVIKALAAKSAPPVLRQALSDLWQLMQQQGVTIEAIPGLLMDAEAHNLSSTLVAHLRQLDAGSRGSSAGGAVAVDSSSAGAGAAAVPGQLQSGGGSRQGSTGGAAAGGGAAGLARGPTLDDLKQRLSQLQTQQMQSKAAVAPPAAAAPVAAAVAASPVPAAAAAPVGPGQELIGANGTGAEPEKGATSRMQSLRDRMKGLVS